MAYCPSCGKPLREGASFCAGCGAKLPAGATAPATRAPVAGPAAGPPAYADPPRAVVAPQPAQPTAAYGAPAVRPQAVPPRVDYATAGVAAPMAGGSLVAAAAAGQLMSWNGQTLNPGFAGRKLPAGILAIFFGTLGIHKFILGYVGAGIAMLAITIVCSLLSLTVIGAFLGVPVISILALIGLIEGIIYLTKSDDEFIQRYGIHHKGWF